MTASKQSASAGESPAEVFFPGIGRLLVPYGQTSSGDSLVCGGCDFFSHPAACNSVAFADFALGVYPFLELQPFHRTYYRVLEAFAAGRIRRLIVTMPPQHGKSLGASTLLPAYVLGLDPDCRVAIASYSGSLASKFNRRVQRILESREYASFFPATTIKCGSKPPGYIRTSEEVEIVGRRGGLLSVGREGSLTGNRVDCFILDDLYKDALEANSPIVRANCWEWYTSVVRTRMHNASRELVVFTRWHEEDLIGSIREREPVEELLAWEQLDALPSDGWLHLNFEALKCGPPSPIDPRLPGQALWEEQHGAALLAAKRRLDPLQFEAMYQGHPSAREGLLYGPNLTEYECLPREIVRWANYTDTADTGDDYLCSLCYAVDADGAVYVTDAVYSREPMEVTEPLVAEMLAGGVAAAGGGFTLHSDRGWHYRTPDWVRACGEAGVERSMSRKGHSPDNAACEGFFGRLKVEFFHGRDWRGVSAERFAAELAEWIRWYREGRLKAFDEGGRKVYDLSLIHI